MLKYKYIFYNPDCAKNAKYTIKQLSQNNSINIAKSLTIPLQTFVQ